jgi:Domain of unknown function (DUF4412)
MARSPHRLLAARTARGLATLAIVLALASSGCSKLRAMVGGDGGATADSEGGPGAAAGDTLALLDGFEGEIDVTGKGDKPGEAPVSLAVLIKEGKIRVDIPESLAKSGAGPLGSNAKGYGILDSAAKKVYVVLDSSKQVIVIDLNKVGEQVKGLTPPSPAPRPEHGNAAPKEAPPKVTKTGKYDTVAGYQCENWDVTSDHREGTVCVAQEGFSWLSFPMAALNGVPTEHLWMAELLDGKHFPLRFIGFGPDGVKETRRIEVTKVDKKTLPATDFVYPPTYAVIDIAQMFRGLGAMGAMGGAPGIPGGFPVPPHHK